MDMDPQRVIRSYLIINGLFTLSASLIWGINTLFLLHADLSIFEVFVANAAFTVASVAMIVGTVGGGLLGQINLSLPYIARTALVLMAFAVGYRTMHEIGFTPRALQLQGVVGEMRKVGRTGITYGWRAPAVRLLVMESFVTWGFFSWAWYAWQPYFLELYGKDAVWLSGLIAALFSLAGIAGNA